MGQGVLHELRDVGILQCIAHMLAYATPRYDLFPMQDPKPLRNGRECLAFQLRQLAYAAFSS